MARTEKRCIQMNSVKELENAIANIKERIEMATTEILYNALMDELDELEDELTQVEYEMEKGY